MSTPVDGSMNIDQWPVHLLEYFGWPQGTIYVNPLILETKNNTGWDKPCSWWYREGLDISAAPWNSLAWTICSNALLLHAVLLKVKRNQALFGGTKIQWKTMLLWLCHYGNKLEDKCYLKTSNIMHMRIPGYFTDAEPKIVWCGSIRNGISATSPSSIWESMYIYWNLNHIGRTKVCLITFSHKAGLQYLLSSNEGSI